MAPNILPRGFFVLPSRQVLGTRRRAQLTVVPTLSLVNNQRSRFFPYLHSLLSTRQCRMKICYSLKRTTVVIQKELTRALAIIKLSRQVWPYLRVSEILMCVISLKNFPVQMWSWWISRGVINHIHRITYPFCTWACSVLTGPNSLQWAF